ncbi:hypothetical protein [Sporosarcina koreensis]|uniref:hypothetical protein n=1 Tax=Sporosarcina koreensis TaxID=334735 RepID=UPI00075B3D24|nr:hypothetical protein [Sporosarcina koreensis]
MAKLENVRTIDMVNGEITKIAYDGAEYVKVEEEAKVDDILLRVKNGITTQVTVGEFYEAHRNEGGNSDKVYYRDEGGDVMNSRSSNFVAFRKVNADITTVLAEVADRVTALEGRVDVLEGKDEELKEGDKVRISGASVYGRDSDGEYGTYQYADSDGEHFVKLDSGTGRYFFRRQLTKVDAPTQTITHNGAEYTLVDRKAQPGDVVVFTENSNSNFTKGKAYGTVYERGDALRVLDIEGIQRSLYHPTFKRTEANTLVYAPKAQSFQVGDYVKPLPSADSEYGITGGSMKLGKVKTVNSDLFYIEVVAHENSRIIGRELNVRTKHFRKATQEEVEAVTQPKTGDIVVITANTNGSRNAVGDIGKVGYTDGICANVDVPGKPKTPKVRGNWTILTEMRLATPAEIAKYEAAVADAEKPKLKVGDYAVVTGGSNGLTEVGDVARIVKDDNSSIPYKLEHTNGGYAGWKAAVNLRKATDAEVAKAKAPKLKAGDYVRALADGEYDDMLEGDLGKVEREDEYDEYSVKVRLLDGSDYDFFRPQDIELVDAETAQKAELFAKIGRKVDEFKKGDIVRYVPGETKIHGLREYPGIITEVEKIGWDGTILLREPAFVTSSYGMYTAVSELELLTPVESRVDRK